MCNPFSDLETDFEELARASAKPAITEEQHDVAYQSLANASHEKPKGDAVYEEPCPKCKGSGRFVGYTGRVVGNCFNCKGSGTVTFKTSPEARAKGKEQRDALKERQAAEKAKAAGAWMAANEAETKWIGANAGSFDFAKAMLDALLQYGSLTDKQMAAIHRCMARDAQREAERAEIAERAPDIATDALDKIQTAFASALEKDIKYPKMRLDAFLFSLVRSGANAGAIYVKSIAKDEAGERRYFGKIVEGRFFKTYKVTDEEQQRIVAAASDPEAAAIAYGRREGACSICGRKLTNHASIDRGIGPICADTFGW